MPICQIARLPTRRRVDLPPLRVMAMRKLIVLLLATVCFCLSPAAFAAPVPKGTYTIDPRHTQIIFGIRHMGLSTY